MIQTDHIIGTRHARLCCDVCCASFLYVLLLDRPRYPTTDEQRQLRELAQQAGWMFVLVSADGQPPRDLCPGCFTLPPEG